uniref:hypothetical protein n=1 Tax=Veillonella magna TaxID=464322 RepID=UPI00402A84E6
MKKEWMVALGIIGMLGCNQGPEAAQDVVMEPTTQKPMAITAIHEPTTGVMPSREVARMSDTYAAWYGDRVVHFYNVNGHVQEGKQVNDERFLYYMRVRLHFYNESHNWKKNSYGYITLKHLYEEYASLLANVPIGGKLEGAMLLEPLVQAEPTVYDNELRTYMNEMVLFAMRESMKDDNPTQQELPSTIDAPIDLWAAIQGVEAAPTKDSARYAAVPKESWEQQPVEDRDLLTGK